MKTLSISILFVLLCSASVFAQVRIGMGYQNSRPLGSMSMNINNIHQFKLEGLAKVRNSQLWIGGELGFGGYASRRDPIAFEMDGYITNTYINISNNVTNLGLIAQYDLMRDFRVAMPYLHAAAGTNIYGTKLTIEDPNDEDGCEPLDSDVLKRDYAVSASLGAGVRINLARTEEHSHNPCAGRVMLDLRAFYTLGTAVSYMNTNEMTATNPDHANHNPRTDSEEVSVPFRSNRTNDVHNHRVGTVFTDPVNHFGVQVALSFSIGD